MTNFGVPSPLEDLPDEFEAPTLGFMAEFWGAITFGRASSPIQGANLGVHDKFWGAIAFGRASSPIRGAKLRVHDEFWGATTF